MFVELTQNGSKKMSTACLKLRNADWVIISYNDKNLKDCDSWNCSQFLY